MVDALEEACRVLTPSGVLIDLRPVTEPIVLEVVIAARPVWAKTVHTYSAPEDVAAADAAVQLARSREWLVFGTSVSFSFDIYCDNPDELRAYAEARKLQGAEIPYEELEERLRQSGREAPRLRCRRPWMLSTYRRK